MPKITFKTWAFYEQSLKIGESSKTWTSDDQNPIYKYIPSWGLPDGSIIPPYTVGIINDGIYEPNDTGFTWQMTTT